MYYCEACRVDNNWPTSFSHSLGCCECCGNRAECHDRPSSSLPLIPRGPTDEERFQFLCTVADNPDGPESKALEEVDRAGTVDKNKLMSIQLREGIDKALYLLKQQRKDVNGNPV